MSDIDCYSAVSFGDGWCVIDNIVHEVISYHDTEEEAVERMSILNNVPYLPLVYNDERDQLIYWH